MRCCSEDRRSWVRYLVLSTEVVCGPASVIGIATGYGLDGPGIESRWERDFRTCPDRPWGPPSLLYNGYRVFPGGKERPRRDADSSSPSSAVGHERVELYLYSPYGPYGLYRASVPVQGCTLPLPLQVCCQVIFSVADVVTVEWSRLHNEELYDLYS